jgi:hypothetical protein
MKKLILIFLTTCCLGQFAIAQKQSATAPSNATATQVQENSGLTYEQKMASVKNCPELLKQLTAKFGKNFSLNDSKVIEQLVKNTSDAQVAPVIRKVSIYIINNSATK